MQLLIGCQQSCQPIRSQIVSRRAVTINTLTPSKTTNQFVLAELYFNWVYIQHITWYKVLLAVPHFNPETNTRVPLCPAICILQKKRTEIPSKAAYWIHHPYSGQNPNICEIRMTSSQHRAGGRENKFTILLPGRNWISAGSLVTRNARIYCKLGRPAPAYAPYHDHTCALS